MSTDPRLSDYAAGFECMLFMVFYRNPVAAALDADRDQAMDAIRDEVVGFAMPWPAGAISHAAPWSSPNAGIDDLRKHHDEVITPVLRTGASSTEPARVRVPSRHATSSPSS